MTFRWRDERRSGGVAVQQRNTRQRAAIVELLEGVEEFRSAQQLHELLTAKGTNVGLATVYRWMQSLSESGDVDVLRSGDGEALYRRCDKRAHHHHLVCRSCGTAVEIDGPSVEAWATTVGAAHGFTDIEHTMEMFGMCAVCRAQNAAERG